MQVIGAALGAHKFNFAFSEAACAGVILRRRTSRFRIGRIRAYIIWDRNDKIAHADATRFPLRASR